MRQNPLYIDQISILGGNKMEVFAEYLARIDNPQHKARMEEVLGWVAKKFPNLMPKIAWNQPMFTHHGIFIIGFSLAKHHLAVAPESAGINPKKRTGIAFQP